MLHTKGGGTRHHRRRLSDSVLDELVTRPPRAALAMVKSNGRRKPATRRPPQPFEPHRAHVGYIRHALNGEAPLRTDRVDPVTPPPRVCTSFERTATVPSFSFDVAPSNPGDPQNTRGNEAGGSGSAGAGDSDVGSTNGGRTTIEEKPTPTRGISAPSLSDESSVEDQVSTNNPTTNDTASENANDVAPCCAREGADSSACARTDVRKTEADSEKANKTQSLIKQSARQLSSSLLYPRMPAPRARTNQPLYKINWRYYQQHNGRWRTQARLLPVDMNAPPVRAAYEALRSPTGNAPAPDIDSLIKTLSLMDGLDAQLDELDGVVAGMIAELKNRGAGGVN